MKFHPVNVIGRDIDEVWFKLLHEIYLYGRPYVKDEGSFAGSEMLELDQVFGTILEPLTYNDQGVRRPLAVTVPGGVSAPTTDQYIEEYFVRDLMDSDLAPNEHYRYSTFIVGGDYKIPQISLGDKVFINPQLFFTENRLVKAPNQLQWAIDHYRKVGFHNNHCCIQVGYPESNQVYNRPYTNELERGTSPCLRLIDTKIIEDGGEHYLCFHVIFRAWNLWAGWPTNVGGLALLMEYIAHELGIKPGALSFSSKAMNIYRFQLDSVMRRIGV